jgi:hypothetical protein
VDEIEYTVVSSVTYGSPRGAVSNVQRDVRRHLEDGWVPSGGLALAADNTGVFAAQAMIRERRQS